MTTHAAVVEILREVQWRNRINCTGPGEVGCYGRKGWHSRFDHDQHVAEEQATALADAGLTHTAEETTSE